MACAETRRRSQYIGAGVGLAIGVPIVIAAALYALPQLEARYWPVIDPKTDIVTDVRIVGNDLCWRSTFDKLREASIASITRELRIYGALGNVGRVTAVPRRVGGPAAPNVDIVDLVPGHYSVDWCQALWTLNFVKVEVTFNSEYRTHRWWTVPTPRPTVVYEPPA